MTLRLSNETELNAFLAALSDRGSPLYHRYLTARQFDDRFSPSAQAYASVAQYFETSGVSNLTLLPDRVSLAFDASTPLIDSLFHTVLGAYSMDGTTYYAPTEPPALPAALASAVAQVSGLSTYPQLHLLGTAAVLTPTTDPLGPDGPLLPDGYLAPPTVDGVQYEYAPDFQVSYDEQSLFSAYGYPTDTTVATILWSGAYEGTPTTYPCAGLRIGQRVGPFVPTDVYGFYNGTLPSGEPHAQVVGVPIAGAPAPGPEATCDATGASVENTLDLEMVGSTAPGAQIYNVYGPDGTSTYTDEAFADILSPPASLPLSVQDGLANVSVITNSWGGTDANDSSWYSSLQQAQARGISVLASTGDSDDNVSSSHYVGSTVEFPSSMAYNAFGVAAVGGTTVSLNASTLELASQVVWNNTVISQGGPVGSTGGISAVFPEPSWQTNTEAGSVLNGTGRGVPDLAGLANNTLMTLTYEGVLYRATNASTGGSFIHASGTSVSSPLTAGLLAEIDHVLHFAGEGPLGFLDPSAYHLASSAYLNDTPAAPFSDVTVGSNFLYSAFPGYDLATGWGSLDAANFTNDILPPFQLVTFTETGLPSGTAWSVHVSGGNSYSSTNGTLQFGEPNGTYNFTASSTNTDWAGPAGQFVVNGTAVSVPVRFVQDAFPVKFVESGLPSRALALGWTVELGGTVQKVKTTSVTFTGYGNATYPYVITGPGGYRVSGVAPSGNLSVSAGGQSVNVAFVKGQTYALTIKEKGLPHNQTWYFDVGGTILSTETTSAKLGDLTPGEYDYSLLRPTTDQTITLSEGRNTLPLSGVLDLSSSAALSLKFVYRYNVTFTETGLTGGTWSVTVKGVTETEPYNSSIEFHLANGTYAYSVRASETRVKGIGSPGKVDVAGAPTGASVTFTTKK